MKHWSIKRKLMSLLGLICVMAAGQFGFMAYQQIKAIHDGKDTLVEAVAESYIDKIDRNLFERYGDVQAFSLSEPARSGNPARIKAFMADMMGAYTPIYDAMIVVNAEGKVIAVNTVDKSGKELDSSWMIGKDYSNEEWFKTAINGKIDPGTSFVEDLHVDEDVAKLMGNNGWVMNFTSPIRDKATGAILGVWTNRMSWKDVVQTITKEELDKVRGGAITAIFPYLMDANGKLLLGPDESKVLKETPEDFKELAALSKTKGDSVIAQSDLETSFFKGPVHEAFSPSKGYSIYPGKGWFAKIQINAEDSTITFSWYLIAFGIFCLTACSLLGWWIINGLTTELGGIMSSLNADSTEVRASAVQVTEGSQNLASAANEQAAALQETASSIEEMSAMIKKSADSATRSLNLSNDSQEAASRGKQAVENMIQAIRDINASNDDIMKQVEASNAEITEIVKVITEIGNKTKVINDIVFQTKLLSFNASVEAARAGEHGKGFAVVAEEVGNLAQMSGNAAKEISDMLGSSIHKVEQIVESTKSKVERLIQEGKQKVETGTTVANQCNQILDDVVRNVSEVNTMIGEITSAGQEQSQGVSEITRAMNQLDQVTHQNASTSQQSANAAAQLTQRADGLLQVVRNMKALVDGRYEHSSMEAFVRSPQSFIKHGNPMPSTTLKPLGNPTSTHEAKPLQGSKVANSSEF